MKLKVLSSDEGKNDAPELPECAALKGSAEKREVRFTVADGYSEEQEYVCHEHHLVQSRSAKRMLKEVTLRRSRDWQRGFLGGNSPR